MVKIKLNRSLLACAVALYSQCAWGLEDFDFPAESDEQSTHQRAQGNFLEGLISRFQTEKDLRDPAMDVESPQPTLLTASQDQIPSAPYHNSLPHNQMGEFNLSLEQNNNNNTQQGGWGKKKVRYESGCTESTLWTLAKSRQRDFDYQAAYFDGREEFLELNLKKSRVVTNEELLNLKYLRTLELGTNILITDQGISGLTTLTELDLDSNTWITDEGIKGLTNLQELSLNSNYRITDEAVRNFTDLRILTLINNYKISFDGVKGLKKLDSVKLDKYSSLYFRGVELLHDRYLASKNYKGPVSILKEYEIDRGYSNIVITPEIKKYMLLKQVLQQGLLETMQWMPESQEKLAGEISSQCIFFYFLTRDPTVLELIESDRADFGYLAGGIMEDKKVVFLDLSQSTMVNDNQLKGLTNLHTLVLGSNKMITDEGLKHLVNLTSLDLTGNNTITSDAMTSLVKLHELIGR